MQGGDLRPDSPLNAGKVTSLLLSGATGWRELAERVTGQGSDQGAAWKRVEALKTGIHHAQYEDALARAKAYSGPLPYVDIDGTPKIGLFEVDGRRILHIILDRSIGRGQTKRGFQTIRVDKDLFSLGLCLYSYNDEGIESQRWQRIQKAEIALWRGLLGDHLLPPPEAAFGVDQAFYSFTQHLKEMDLKRLLHGAQAGRIELSEEGARELLLQCVMGIRELHRQGMGHGDLHYGNVLVSSVEKGHFQAWLTDFGLSRELDDTLRYEDLTALTMLIGQVCHLLKNKFPKLVMTLARREFTEKSVDLFMHQLIMTLWPLRTGVSWVHLEAAIERGLDYDGELPAIDRRGRPHVVIAEGERERILHIVLPQQVGSGGTKQAWKTLRIEGAEHSIGLYTRSTNRCPSVDKPREWRLRQLAELSIWKELRGEHILPPPEARVETRTRIHMVSRHLKECSVAQLMERAALSVELLPPPGLKGIAIQMVQALDEMHGQNFAHRDLHLDNYLVEATGKGTYRVWIIDFETTKPLTDKRKTKDLRQIGFALEELAEHLIETHSPFAQGLHDLVHEREPCSLDALVEAIRALPVESAHPSVQADADGDE